MVRPATSEAARKEVNMERCSQCGSRETRLEAVQALNFQWELVCVDPQECLAEVDRRRLFYGDETVSSLDRLSRRDLLTS
jgi:hypothetical protein